MEERLEEIKINVANFKRKITNFVNFVDKYKAETDFPILQKRKDDVDKFFIEFDKWHSDLEIFVTHANHPKVRTEYEEKYYSSCSKAIAYLNSPPAAFRIVDSALQETQGIERDYQSRVTHNSRTNLPRLNLPSFNGSYDTWLGFHDLFKSLVDDDKSISNIEKLYYLKGCLKDDAAQILSSIELSSENYEVAWKLLKERYDNRKIIRQTHVNAILTLPSISREFSVRLLLDQVQKHVRALEALKEPVDKWDTLLIEIIKQKLNKFICEKWEESSNESTKPTFRELTSFLQFRAQLDDTTAHNLNKIPTPFDKKNTRFNPRSQQSFTASTNKNPCPHCTGDHLIYHCEAFKKLPPAGRFEAAKKAKSCINCLRSNHRDFDCTGSHCRKCNKKHNSLLHFEKQSNQNDKVSSPESPPEKVVTCHAQLSSEGLLATALVELVNEKGKSKTCRAFLDAGSQANFITERVASHLKLSRKLVDISVTGVDNISTEIKNSVSATLISRFSRYEKKSDFLVVNQITKLMPSISINQNLLEIPKNITLADPAFYKSAEIDILIGVKLFYKLLSIGQFSLKNHPDVVLQKTQLGWIIAGEFKNSFQNNEINCHLTVHSTPLDVNLTRFWELEKIPSSKLLSPQEQACENHFKENVQRNAEGRYIVKLPFNIDKLKLGDSHFNALRRFHFLEKRFGKDPKLKANYFEFIDEYENLNHMSLVENKSPNISGFYLPHHAVIKEDSVTTKTRVVFDGSAKTATGISLNDTLMVGPTIQDDLFTIVTRFRSHRYALTADIEKMYRQILVHPDDVHYQKILFRKNPAESLKEFFLKTVTYGTSCAPFLAIRVLHQLADDENIMHPIGSSILKKDFYVDDLLTGANTLEEAAFLRNDLSSLLRKGGFHLRKWVSNEPTLISENSDTTRNCHMSLDPNSSVKTLGIRWDYKQDSLFYKVNLADLANTVTKRSILSQLAKLFDPLGLLGPVIVKAKIIIQLLWKAGVSWDSSIPSEIHTMWLDFKGQLPLLSDITFNRAISVPDSVENQLHGFCDASEKAYGACIYLRSKDSKGNCQVSLICSKSRVAPVGPVTLPRLELCAALLLSQLHTTTKQALQVTIASSHLWSDSTITLHWINTEPHLLKTFVANRVAEIQGLSKHCTWQHVPTQDNPADLISRGQTPQEFSDTEFWKTGPLWLLKNEPHWPKKLIQLSETPEKKKILTGACFIESKVFDENFAKRFSSTSKLKRVIVFVFRFINNCRNKLKKLHGPVSGIEIAMANKIMFRSAQSTAFAREINSLKSGEGLPEKSSLIPVNPFLDEMGILRVGGRLIHSKLPEEQKHQILLPANHYLTRLIIREEHERLKHAGTQATLYSVRELFWPLNSRNITRNVIHKCVQCFRVSPRTANYIMGNLPQERVSDTRPFLNVGVDYCGPFYIKERRLRNRNKVKTYVSIFVCLSTKAVHLELVSDLTTEAFLACLKRLFARRGISKTISSDNAKNFVGASRELIKLYELFQSPEHKETMQRFLSQQQITWKFIPPRSPHFGGLWEAAVKSCKHHLTRTVGDTLLTYEQLETCLIEIEAILNSRPLSPMSSDPTDLQPLTPGHFLIGGPLMSFPQIDLTDTPSNRLSAWQHAQKLRHHFWKRWQKEYLNHLTVRNKWQTNTAHSIKIGTMVVINEDNLPPLQWKIGRVIKIHPGPDGIIRVATVKTETWLTHNF